MKRLFIALLILDIYAIRKYFDEADSRLKIWLLIVMMLCIWLFLIFIFMYW